MSPITAAFARSRALSAASLCALAEKARTCLWRKREQKTLESTAEGVLASSCCSEKAAGRRLIVSSAAGASSHVTCTASGSAL